MAAARLPFTAIDYIYDTVPRGSVMTQWGPLAGPLGIDFEAADGGKVPL